MKTLERVVEILTNHFGWQRKTSIEKAAKEIAELIKPKGHFERVYIKTEADLPKDGEYIAHSKIYSQIGIWEFKNYYSKNYPDYTKKIWIQNIDWYLRPVEQKELDGPSEEEIKKQAMIEEGLGDKYFEGIHYTNDWTDGVRWAIEEIGRRNK